MSERKNPPGAERLADALFEALEACRELRAAHGKRCDCDLCTDADGMAYTLATYRDGFECNLVPYPAMSRHRVEEMDREGQAVPPWYREWANAPELKASTAKRSTRRGWPMVLDPDLVIYLHRQRGRLIRAALLRRARAEVETIRETGLGPWGIAFEAEPDVGHWSIDGLTGFFELPACGRDNGRAMFNADDFQLARPPISCPKCLKLLQLAGYQAPPVALAQAPQSTEEPELEPAVVQNPFYA